MSNQLANVNPEAKLQTYMRSPEIVARFAELMGQRQASGYVSSVLIAVAQNPSLSECSPRSIVTSAMRAATLKLSCDPATKQAHLVPFKGKATLVVGYKGMYDMAIRTNKYRFLNDFPVYEGQEVAENQLTGEIKINGHPASNKVIGYGLYFKLTNGFEKVFYMTVEEIEAHAARYSKTYSRNDSPWKTDFEKMARKTVIRLGLGKYGYLDPMDVMALDRSEEVEGEDTTLPGLDEVTVPAREKKTQAQILSELGIPPEEQHGATVTEDNVQEGEYTPEPGDNGNQPAQGKLI